MVISSAAWYKCVQCASTPGADKGLGEAAVASPQHKFMTDPLATVPSKKWYALILILFGAWMCRLSTGSTRLF